MRRHFAPFRVHASSTCALITVISWLFAVTPAKAEDLVFSAPILLSGDDLVAAAAGVQEGANVAAGGSQFLAVWTDYRSSPDDYPPFASEGTGADIYAARLDSDGSLIDPVPFVVDEALGDQIEPRVAWDGQNWLVVWKQQTETLPTYDELRAVRVSPDGQILDASPISIHNDDSYYTGLEVAGGGGGWVVTFQADGPLSGLVAVRVTDDGVVSNPGGLLVHSTNFLMEFDIAFAGDQYMMVWSGSFDSPRARRYTPELSLLGTSALPFGQRVASDGTDFLVVRASGSPPLATIDAVRVMEDGGLTSPVTLFTGGNQDGTCCVDVVWDGSLYWVSWGGPRLARVTAEGAVLDPGGFWVTPSVSPVSQPGLAGVPGGGVQLVYNDGVSAAADPKDVRGGQVGTDTQFGNESVVSVGAPAQLGADFAEGDGVHLVAFLSRGSDSARVLVQRLNDDGVSMDVEPIEVAVGPFSHRGAPSLSEVRAAWNGSLFMVTWSDGIQVFMRRMLADGTFLDPSPRVVMDGRDPDLSAVGDVFLVVALDYIDDNPHWQAAFSMRVDGATGTNLDIESTPIDGFLIFARHPRVETWGNRWLAVWQRNISHDNTIAGTTAAIIEPDGTTAGAIDVPLGWRPQVAVSPTKALFVAVTGTIATATTDLEGVIMNEDGSFQGSPFGISDAEDKQLRPCVTWNGTEFIVAWEDKRGALIYFDERTDIFGTRVLEDGTVMDPSGVALLAEASPEIRPALFSTGGQAFLASSSLRPAAEGAAYRIVVQRSLAPADVEFGEPTGPLSVRLGGVRPNPMTSAGVIYFDVEADVRVDVSIFDATGARVRSLAEQRLLTGGQTVEMVWDGLDDAGRELGSGVYFYEVRTPLSRIGQRLVLVR